ncbi:amastin-like surface protein-like protein [Leishmania donovani]|uniref:Amastin-like_surface_protein-like_protein n=3 Tax=Leishmania donovani species complex TaxID=38574 RepID=A0A6L0XEN2_LEIIN|nr:amastin-like surface protein-like protein [Leishmania infantum JPCM5]XP_003861221.1 amastin-like surface protein-like protein [Leishmania donovani]CAC9491820.1 amastin-like_surface_protein-like_protein [Leishmania infantum]AYU79213.1 amastin-like surface protein-like protein [Leishmania donovani]TPP44928.1 Amastin surface glycofamily protein [Leishmania donovani]TPP52257.1 Amastin surface glycofamily protein [Leishmania donovani]CAJ1989205.1 amastin-like surface protein-like protein [Leish|eukprot:XP_001465956.1 amastin-like surface protein-like protein [Leishmania infantum JPCM5]
MGLLPPFVGALLFTVIQFLVLLFVVIATPISQIDSKTSRTCYTFWGMKSDCRKVHYTAKGKGAFGNCRQRLNNMSGGAAFAIVSVFTTLAALVFGILMLIRVSCAVVFPLIFTCISIFTIFISWACVAGAYTIKMCGMKWSNYSLEYGPGFGLMITAWCLQIVNVLVLVLISFF